MTFNVYVVVQIFKTKMLQKRDAFKKCMTILQNQVRLPFLE